MHSLLKQLLSVVCQCMMLPAVVIFHVQGRLTGYDAAFAGWSQLLSLLPGTSGVWLRRAFLAGSAQQCDSGVCVSFGSVFSSRNIRLGANTYVGHFCSIGDVTIESDVLIASHVSIMNGVRQHGTARLDLPVREQAGVYEPITIGQDTWIGEHATVAASVGRHCVIGAGALVLKPVPDFAVAVGVPARVVGDRRTTRRDDESAAVLQATAATAHQPERFAR